MKIELYSICFLFMLTFMLKATIGGPGSGNGQYKYDFGVGNPSGPHKYELDGGNGQYKYDFEVSNSGPHKYELDGPGSGNGQYKYDFGVGNPSGPQKYELNGRGRGNGQHNYWGPNGQDKYCFDCVEKMTVHPGEGRKWTEALFFREKMLNEGVVMQMPDIRDKIPKRSFLSHTLIAKLPSFTTKNINLLKEFLRVSDNSVTENMMKETLGNCERAPSRGEKIKCVRSMFEMANFASSVLGPKVVVRKTLNVKGSGKYVMMGRVSRLHGGNVTESVTCHQEMFPVMLLYFCHYIPMVRVYEVEILDLQKIKINQAVAVCHLNTSSWSRNHPAFLELGSTPGEIEVCHWIYENDMSWTADAN